MIDLIKYFVLEKDDFVNTMKDSDKVDLKVCVNYNTGEFLNKMNANYNNMFVEITDNRASLKGSLHKYFNTIEGFGSHNHNDFSFCDFEYAISHLQDEFGIDKSNTKITNLEFGLNIEIDRDPQNLIDKQILMYNYKLPNRNEKFYGKGDFIEFKTTDYSLKIYNKSKQYNLNDRHTLRVELKITKSRYLVNHFNITSITDLDKKRFYLLFKKLLEHFNKLMIIDSLDLFNSDDIEDRVLFKLGTNPYHWLELNENSKRKMKFKRKFKTLLKDYDLVKTKTYLRLCLEGSVIITLSQG